MGNCLMVPTQFDFLLISSRPGKFGITEIYPRFRIRNPSQQLMIKGGDFYAVWVESKGLWSVNEQDCLDIIDEELDKCAKANADRFENGYQVMYMWDAQNGMIDRWHNFCKKQMRDSYHILDETLIFSNSKVNIKDYASKRLDYPLKEGTTEAWDRIVSVLYSEEERHKIEWSIGAIVSGESRKLQKFIVFYGAPKTGKSTIIGIIEKLFEGYTAVFDAKSLGSASNNFALESFRSHPLVAIQHDGDLSRIEDNTRLNSLVSHESVLMNVKHVSAYQSKFKAFLIMGTNKPVKITDAKSGLIRRLIDISPTGDRLPSDEYDEVMNQVIFEYGAIAYKCLSIFKDNPKAYDDYIPLTMLDASNDFYNFILEYWEDFKRDDETTLSSAWAKYTQYVKDVNILHPYSQKYFKEELKNYFKVYKDRETLENGVRVRSHYKIFCADKYDKKKVVQKKLEERETGWIDLQHQASLFDDIFANCPAQYPVEDDSRLSYKWANVRTKLKDIDTTKLHYVKTPLELICIDFDIPNENGEKSLELNLEAANKWPKTYAEVSKSGKALHLYYIYDGDVEKLSRTYSEHIEVKVFNGGSSLRRMLTLCNDISISKISNGLPFKEEKKTVNFDSIQSEKGLRTLIQRNMAKEIHPGTKPSIDFIFKILEDAYASDLSYDVSDMKNAVIGFAAQSTHQADYCLKLVGKMKFCSADKIRKTEEGPDGPLIFYDVEVFPNLFLVNWKKEGEGSPVVRMINPTPIEIEEIIRYKLVGFNCRRYDNHILYARLMGYSNIQLYNLSQRIVGGDRNAFFGEAYNLSYTDVYDFASAGNKKSLKKFEIELGIHHQELGLPWDKPVPEEMWEMVAEYCDNDVIATEAVFNHLSADWTARKILSDIAGMTVNDTTNSLTTRIIFDSVRRPQDEFMYRKLSEPVHELREEVLKFLKDAAPEMMSTLHGEEDSLLPYFPGYCHEKGVSTYMDEEVGEGGYVYAEPGMYFNVALLDIASMHPHSIIAECLFGPRFTMRFKEIVDGRVSIKHKAWDEIDNILDGKLTPYIQKVKNGEMTSKQLANALKTAINSVYGLTSAAFENAFRDPRNVDNIVAKRGALFMVNLKHEVQKRGYTVAHIKTDSIKIPDADISIIQFVMDYGKKFGYTFEHEATYDRMCLVNDAVYIAKYDTIDKCEKKYGYIPGDIKDHEGKWTATGKQFAVPYLFKKMFTKEPITINDMCETFSVSGALYLDMNENLPSVEAEEKQLISVLKENGMSYNDYLDFMANDSGDILLKRKLTEIANEIAKGHDYRFVGKVGEFTPIKPGCGGGVLYREAGGKYSAATGSKGYRWMESEMVRTLGREDYIDRSYYDRLVDDAKDTISKYGDFERFVSED